MSNNNFVPSAFFRNAGVFVMFVLVIQLFIPVIPTSAEQYDPVSLVHGTKIDQKQAALSGPTIQLDPTFPYYQNRSVDSIADEIVQNGFKAVHYFVVNENNVNRELIDAFHKRGIPVWALVLGNGSYSVAGFPSDWPEWQMQLLKPLNDGYYRFSPHSEKYVEWKKQALANLVTNYPFDGIEVAEPYFPEWNGIESGVYGDVGPLAQAAFKKQYGLDIPNFSDPSSPNYYKTNHDLYQKWINFRVDTVNSFLNELINGKGGVRDVRKHILVATWSLAIDAGPDSVDLLREYQGLDAAKMISAVKPDIHFLQTHWPDWLKSQDDLPGDYIKNYQNFVDQIRSVHPNIPLGVQADIGSATFMVKDRSWFNLFGKTAQDLGYSSWTAYEYSLGKYIYEEAPIPKHVERTSKNHVIISFQKRVDEASAKLPGSLQIITETGNISIDPQVITVDGNRIIIQSDQIPTKEFKLYITNVTDTPQYWLYNKTFPANSVPDDLIIDIPKQNK